MKKLILENHEDLIAKRVTARDLLDDSFAIADENKKLNAFISLLKDESYNKADEIDAKITSGKAINILEGIPAALKDIFNMTGTKTTAGSKILENYISPYNATVTEKLLSGGAVIMGKTNMDAFAHGSSTETSDFGPALNPYDNSRVPGGSSGGSAIAVATGIVPYAIGTETAGSIRGPAAWCGVYGFAGTFGRISRYGIIAMGSSLDRAGVIANSVYDCALVADILGGMDEFDATTIRELKTEYATHLNDNYVSGIRIGIPKQFLDSRIDKEVSETSMKVIKSLEKLGAKIIEIDLMDPKYSIAVYTIINRSEVSSNLARIDGIRFGHDSSKTEEEIINHIALSRGEAFGNEAQQRSLTGAYSLSAGYYNEYYSKASKVRTLIINDFKKAFEKVDLIMGPTMPTVAPKLGVTKNNPLFGELADILAEPSALSGLPCISIPAGLNSEGLPIGVQIIGPQFSEQKVLDLAYTCERRVL